MLLQLELRESLKKQDYEAATIATFVGFNEEILAEEFPD